MPELILVGLNHRTAPVALRERVHVGDEALDAATSSLRALPGVEGASLLSTCNRLEAIVSAASSDVATTVVEWLSERAGAPADALRDDLYTFCNEDVVQHLVRVAAGLDSMIVGEPQIGGQVRRAFQASLRLGSLDPLLQQAFEHTMRAAKKVRSETAIGAQPVSVPGAALDLAKKIFGELRGLRVLLIGAGEIGELTAEQLYKHEVKQVIVANRSYARAVQLAQRFGGEAARFDNLDEYLRDCHVVIASTAAPHYVLQADQVQRALDARRSRSLFLIDLSVPRNIDPAVSQLEGAYLYNVDDLQNVVDSHLEERKKEAESAESIVTREVDAFRKRRIAEDAIPTIVELQKRLEQIRAAELEKCLRRVGSVTDDQRQAIEMLTTQMINKILHYPIVQLKYASDEPQERESTQRTIRRVFGLQ